MSSSKNANNVSQHNGGRVVMTEVYKVNRSFAQPTPSSKKVEANEIPKTEEERQEAIANNTKEPNQEDKKLFISEDLSNKKIKKSKIQEEDIKKDNETEDLESE